MNYVLEPRALRQLAQVLDQTQSRFGTRRADALEDTFWQTFGLLARSPGLGHRRADLTDGDYFFYLVRPYYVIYQKRIASVAVLSIVHSARDVYRLLKRT